MLVASIREGQNNYYVKVKKRHNQYCYQVVCANNDETFILSSEEANRIIDKMFQSNLVFLKKEGQYTIYLDEANNKRFFQGNKEDLTMFFLNNGKNALLHNETEDDQELDDKGKNIKNFVMKRGNRVVKYTIIYLLTVILSASGSYGFSKFVYDEINESLENLDLLSFTDIVYYLRNSNDKILTKDMTDYFINNALFSHILSVSDSSRNYILREKLNNFGIKYFTKEERGTNRAGYYQVSDLNHIHLADNSIETFNYAAAHEFIHLLQDDNQYLYIREASAEILAHEYYGCPVTAYPEARKRLYVLMEIIGPQVIFECNFKGNTSTFEDKMHEVLEEKDADELLELFTNSPFYDQEVEKTNAKIDQLLAKMYRNMYKTEITDNDFINHIYASSCAFFSRYYFNGFSQHYYENFAYSLKKEILDFDSVMSSDFLVFIDEERKQITKDEFENELRNKNIMVEADQDNKYYQKTINYYNSLEDYNKKHGDSWDYAHALFHGKKIYYFKPYGDNPEQFIYKTYLEEPSIYQKFPNQFNNVSNIANFSDEIDKILLEEKQSSNLFEPKRK